MGLREQVMSMTEGSAVAPAAGAIVIGSLAFLYMARKGFGSVLG